MRLLRLVLDSIWTPLTRMGFRNVSFRVCQDCILSLSLHCRFIDRWSGELLYYFNPWFRSQHSRGNLFLSSMAMCSSYWSPPGSLNSSLSHCSVIRESLIISFPILKRNMCSSICLAIDNYNFTICWMTVNASCWLLRCDYSAWSWTVFGHH
jgi:hypothetical protein